MCLRTMLFGGFFIFPAHYAHFASANPGAETTGLATARTAG